MDHVWRIAPGLFWGAVVCAVCYWFLFSHGIHVGRGETAYWLFLLTAAAIILRAYIPHKPKSDAEFDDRHGYWRLHLNMTADVCFATRAERDNVPKPLRFEGQ